MSQTMETMFREIVREEVREALKDGFAELGRPWTANTPKKLSLTEAGKLLGFSYPSMLQLARREDFPAFQVLGKWVIPYDKLMDWLEHNADGDAGVSP
jgi:hypothetical protein